MQDEECFYQCEPMLGYFQIGTTGHIQNVPVCADYCDAWFDACRDDLTCVENWLEDLVLHVTDGHGNNSCPANSTCTTFRERYGNGEGLCNRMWGKAFIYSTNMDNCTVMAFNNNPNYRLTFPHSDIITTPPQSDIPTSASTSVVIYGSLLLTSLLIASATYWTASCKTLRDGLSLIHCFSLRISAVHNAAVYLTN